MAEKEMKFTYQVQDFTVTVSTEEYIRRFSNSECFIKYCKECRNYGKVWVCPPFSHDTMAGLLTRAGYEPVIAEDMEAAKHEVVKLSPGAVINSQTR